MSQEGGESRGVPENPVEDVIKQENEQLNLNPVVDWNLVEENGYHEGNAHSNYSHDELVQMVVELNFQNEYMKSQYECLKNHILDSDRSDQQKVHNHDDLGCGDVREMSVEIESLKRELVEERQTRGAAEESLRHLRAAHLEADMKAQELSAKLAEAQHETCQEIQERDEKYSELDSKFNRLHKRAKQRIQEVHKVHTKRRNRLEQQRVNALVFTKYNLRLEQRHQKRVAQGDAFDPISLSDMESDDEWITEREDPALPEDTSWLDID